MPVEIPTLDREDEDARVADAIAQMPPEATDRNPSSIEVKLLEAVGTFYGLLGYFADQLSDALKLAVFERVGLSPEPGEAVSELEARGADAFKSTDQAISRTSFEQMVARIDGIRRATVVGAGSSVIAHILADDFNQAPNPALYADARQALDLATVPGAVVVVSPAPVRLVDLVSVEAKLASGTDPTAVRMEVADIFRELVDASVRTWGAPLYANTLVARFSDVAGVERIGAIRVKTSDDYGQSWSPHVVIGPTAPINAPPPQGLGLLHDAKGFPGAQPTPQIVLL